MIYAGLALFLPVIWFLPWWSVALVSFAVGLVGRDRGILFSVAGGIVWAALAFIKDGQQHGVISRRMAGLFQLRYPSLIFALVFTIAFITVLLSYSAGKFIRMKRADLGLSGRPSRAQSL